MSIGKKVRTCQFTTPEVKVFFGFCYLLAVLVSLWTISTVKGVTADAYQDRLEIYARCMATGSDNPDCEQYKKQLEDLSYPALDVIYLLLIAFLNFSNLPFVVQFKTFKHSVRRVTKRLSSKSLSSFQ